MTTRPTWEGVLAPIGEETGDGRVFATDSEWEFRQFPLPLRFQEKSSEGHDEAVVVGRILEASVQDGKIIGRGELFTADLEPLAEKARALLVEEVCYPSVDVCKASSSWVLYDENGTEVTPEEGEAMWEAGNPPREVQVIEAGQIMGATLVAGQAFETARIVLTGETEAPDDEGGERDALIAAAGPRWTARAEWFENPKLQGPTALQVTEEGQVFGHVASWDARHLMDGRTKPPRSRTGYAMFHVSAVDTDRGRMPVGRLTIGGGHASLRAGVRAATEHYDDVGTTWAFVRAGEDQFGIWVAGQVNPDAPDHVVRLASGTPLSGDWRVVNGNREMVAAHGVNVPGFAVLRPRAYTDDHGREMALVAAGTLAPGQGSRFSRAVARAELEEVAGLAAREAVSAYKAGEEARERLSRVSAARSQASASLAVRRDHAIRTVRRARGL